MVSRIGKAAYKGFYFCKTVIGQQLLYQVRTYKAGSANNQSCFHAKKIYLLLLTPGLKRLKSFMEKLALAGKPPVCLILSGLQPFGNCHFQIIGHGSSAIVNRRQPAQARIPGEYVFFTAIVAYPKACFGIEFKRNDLYLIRYTVYQ